MSLVYTPQCTTALLRHFSMYNDLGAECTSLMALWIVYPVPKDGKNSVSRACIRWVVSLRHSASRPLTSPSNLTSSLAYVQHNTHLVIDEAHPTGIYLLEAARYFRNCQCTYTGSAHGHVFMIRSIRDCLLNRTSPCLIHLAHGLTLPNGTDRVRICLQVGKNRGTLSAGPLQTVQESCARNEQDHGSGMAGRKFGGTQRIRFRDFWIPCLQ